VNLNNIKTMSILDKITKKKDDKKDVKEKEEKKVIDKKTDEKEVKRVIEKKKGKSSGKSVKAKKVSKEKMPIHYFELIKKPHISEKALTFNSVNKYVFVVSRSANKS
jgi:hypothetical protein